MTHVFDDTVLKLNRDLAQHIPEWGVLDRCACIGNAAHESGGFKLLQELKPVVLGSAGGWGFFQWTGPRRRAFMAYAKKNELDPSSYEAQIGFLIFELRTSEAATVPRVRKAKTLDDKTVAFELAFERAGVKHYDSRKRWAEKAWQVIQKNGAAEILPPEMAERVPPPPPPLTSSKTIWSALASYVSGGGAALLAGLNGLDWKVLAVLILAGGLVGLIIYERVRKG